MNPLLIRHLYGSVRKNRFFWLMTAYLLGIGLLTITFTLLTTLPTLLEEEATISMLVIFTEGRALYWFSTIVLILTTMLLVPINALSAVAGERENRTLDLLVTTTMKPRNIILGKLLSVFLTGALYILAPIPILMTGYWLGGVTTIELILTLLLLVLTMLGTTAWALFLSSLVRKTITAVVLFYSILIISVPVVIVLATLIVGLVEVWQYSDLANVQSFWLQALLQHGWVILSGLHPITTAGVTEAFGLDRGSWFFYTLEVERYTTGSGYTYLGTIILPAPWIIYTVITLASTLLFLWITIHRLSKPER